MIETHLLSKLLNTKLTWLCCNGSCDRITGLTSPPISLHSPSHMFEPKSVTKIIWQIIYQNRLPQWRFLNIRFRSSNAWQHYNVCYCVSSACSEAQVTRATDFPVAATFLFIINILQQLPRKWWFWYFEHMVWKLFYLHVLCSIQTFCIS